jgi:hypothetical protein
MVALPVAAVMLLAVTVAPPQAQTAARSCVIDMGSNTFRRIVGSFSDGRYVQVSLDKQPLSVGDDVARTGEIGEATFAKMKGVLAAFRAACEKDGFKQVAAIGTAAFRDATNGQRAVAIAAELGIRMEIATEARESELAYLVGSLGRDGIAVIDNGSRTVEAVSRPAGTISFRVFPLGYRVAYQTFFADATDLGSAVAAFRTRLIEEAQKCGFMKGQAKLVGVEFGDLIEVLFGGGPVEGRVLTAGELRGKLEELTAAGPSGFQALKKRADIDRALPRLVAALVLTEQFGYQSIELTDRELGVGLIIGR